MYLFRKKFILVFIIFLLFIMLETGVAAALSDNARKCRDLGMLRGSGEGLTEEYMASKCRRWQGAIMLLRLMAKEKEALNFAGEDNFSDITPDKFGWEDGRRLFSYLKANPQYGFQGNPDGSFAPYNDFTGRQYTKVLLEVLGYKYGKDFTWPQVFYYADSKGLDALKNVGDSVLTMENIAEATVQALQLPLKSGSATLAERLADEGIINKRLNPSRMIYSGAFRLPEDSEWEWSGEALAFNSSGNEGKGSLFGTGHNHRVLVSEISVPEPVLSKNISGLNRANTLQPFSSAWGDLYSDWYTEIPRIGLEVLNDKLYFCRGEHFQENNPMTHGYAPLNLSVPKPEGLWRIGGEDCNYATNNYMFKIPPEWSSRYAPGFDLATGRYRDGGWGGMGPSLFAVKSGDMIKGQDLISTKELIRYTGVNDWSQPVRHQVDNYSEADTWTGGAWFDSPAGSAVIFCGNHGFGENTWYGFANGVVYPTDGEGPFPETPEYPYNDRGWWNDGLKPALMFYDPVDLGKVLQGEIMPHQVQPYEIVDISAYMYSSLEDTRLRYLGAMAYDYLNHRLLVQELFADGDKPVIHVFEFK